MPPTLVRPTLLVFALTLAATLLYAAAATACPFCDGDPAGGTAVRREVFGPDFWWHVAAAGAPFGVLLAVAAGVYYGPPGRRRGGR